MNAISFRKGTSKTSACSSSEIPDAVFRLVVKLLGLQKNQEIGQVCQSFSMHLLVVTVLLVMKRQKIEKKKIKNKKVTLSQFSHLCSSRL